MAYLLSVKDIVPQFGQNCYLAPNATITGNVIAGDDCSFWFNAVVRGDVNSIRLGHKVNVQDGACIHCTYEGFATHIGNNVSIGHHAIVHGCTLHDNVLIGMGAIIMDGCVVESNSIIAAGAVLTEGTHVPQGTIYGGIPGKKLKDISIELLEGQVNRIANNYVMYAGWYQQNNRT